jgi:hypothetical protein
MKMLKGKDYPWLCKVCQHAIDDAAALYAEDFMADTDDPEAACNYVYDHSMFCGGGECVHRPVKLYLI